MANNKTSLFSFSAGHVQTRGLARVIAAVDQLRDAGAVRSRVMKWSASDGKWSYYNVDMLASRVWTVEKPPMTTYVTGLDGVVAVVTAGGTVLETVASEETGPLSLGPIRDMRFIGQHLYLCGMARQVYRRESKDTWVRLDADTLLARGKIEVAGFNSIDGLNEDDILAVGFNGEIWRFVKRKWHKVDSPTNVVLNQVRVVESGLAYACGQSGVLLRGSGDNWEFVDHESTDDDLWGIEWFNNSLYIAAEDTLFRLNKKDRLEVVDLKLKTDLTHRYLHANDGVMWSFGPKHIVWTDGKKWYDVTP